MMNGLSTKLLLIAALSLTGITTADALILCADSGGNVKATASCPKGWTQLDPVSVGLQGPKGPQGIPGTNGTNGTSGTDGTDGVSGYEVVWSTYLIIEPGAGKSNTAYCPSGKMPIAGGSDTGSGFMAITNSYPVNDGGSDGWRVSVLNRDTAPPNLQFRAVAVCAIVN